MKGFPLEFGIGAMGHKRSNDGLPDIEKVLR